MNSSVLKLTIFCLLSLFLYQEQANAQAYKPTLKPGRMWVFESYFSTYPLPDIYYNYIVDTTETINNQDYYKVYGSTGYHQTLYVREDTTERTIYALSNYVDTEYVLFEFNGLLFNTYSEYPSSVDVFHPITTESNFIATTETHFGVEYNLYLAAYEPTSNSMVIFQFIEGLGGSQGIASASSGYFETFYWLKSVIDSGGVVVMGEPLSVVEVDYQSPILFWINTNKILEISTQNESSELNSYHITNLNGQVLGSGKLNQNQTQVDLNTYSSGLYFLHLTLNTGEQKTEKFILN